MPTARIHPYGASLATGCEVEPIKKRLKAALSMVVIDIAVVVLRCPWEGIGSVPVVSTAASGGKKQTAVEGFHALGQGFPYRIRRIVVRGPAVPAAIVRVSRFHGRRSEYGTFRIDGT